MLLGLVLSLHCSTGLCSAADTDGATNIDQASNQTSSKQSAVDITGQLDKLESKLFAHNYPKDSTADRLERLEKMIFGESQKGTADERVSTLVKAVPNLDNSQSVVTAPPAETNSRSKRYFESGKISGWSAAGLNPVAFPR